MLPKGFCNACIFPDIDYCDPSNNIFSPEGQGAQTEFGYCKPHGTCIDELHKYSCQCDRGWTGSSCETGMSEYALCMMAN